jgi:DNA-binding response OmpR family regulator
MRVLVAEDVEDLANAIAAGLRREGMAVDVVLDGDAALDHLAVTPYDVVVLDRDLPGTHGDEVCRRLAGRPGSRVLMLTAASTVRAIGRRPATSLPPVLGLGDLTLDPGRRVAFRAGRRLDLSPKEFGLLEYLLAAGDRVVSAEELLEGVWDEAADPFTTAVKQTMRRLRAKLGDPPVIRTVREGGYQIGEL